MNEFEHPKNVGEIENPDGVGKVGNPICGDLMLLTIKVEDEKIVDVRFKTFGCASAIATTSMITEMAKGKTIGEALKLTRSDVAEELDGLPAIKMHCSNLAADALHEAIFDYLTKRGRKISVELQAEHDAVRKRDASLFIETHGETH